jgi:hypothetical protein
MGKISCAEGGFALRVSALNAIPSTMKATWIKWAARHLMARYCLTFEDIGQSPCEFERRWRDQAATAEDAVDAFAEKYDLDPVEARH